MSVYLPFLILNEMTNTVIQHKGTYIWKLQPGELYEGTSPEIKWLEFLPPNVGTSYRRSRLIQSTKMVLEAYINTPLRKWRAGISMGTVLGRYGQLRTIAQWMVARGKWQFSELTPDDVLAFLEARRPRHGEGPTARSTILRYLVLFESLWEFRGKYHGSLRFNMAEFEDEVWEHCEVRDSRPWRATEEEFAVALIADSLDWLRKHGQLMRSVAGEIYTAHTKMVGLSFYQKHKLSSALYAGICAKPEFIQMAKALQLPPGGYGVHRAFTIAVGAAMNVLLFMVGFRASELVRLDADCLTIRVDPIHGKIPYLKGIAAKKGGIAREWVAGDPVPEIVKWLLDLHERSRGTHRALFIARSNGSSIPLPGRRLRRMSSASPITAMQAFANAPFRSDRPKAHLHPHAARKTFAAFVVKRDKSALESLSLHFGHVYRAFTDGAYAGDLELARLVDRADRDELGRGLAELLSSPQLAGKGAGSVLDLKKQSRFRGEVALTSMVEQLIERGAKLAPCNWGYCLYSQPLSACKGDSRGPNDILRSPEVCCGCANFVVTRKHLPWWESRAKGDAEFLGREDVPEQTKSVVMRRLAHSETVLRELVMAKKS